MIGSGRRRAALVAAGALVVAAPALAAATPHAAAGPTNADVCGLDHHTSGEPGVAVNPRNPRNIIVVCFSNGEWAAIDYQDIQGEASPLEVFQITEAYTFDGGKTWHRQKLPITDVTYSYTSDPDVLFGPDGTAYAAATLNNRSLAIGGTPVIRSTDGGRTWSPRVFAQQTSDFVTALQKGKVQEVPVIGGPIERPWISIDYSRDLLYASAVTFADVHSGAGGPTNFERYVNVSHDHGKTWSWPIPVDSPQYPTGDSGVMAAAQGIVAIAYAPTGGTSGSKCPCSVFSVSTDEGKTWVQRLIPVAPGGLQAPWIAADQHHRGRFAILNTSGSGVTEAVTSDTGRTWKVTHLTTPTQTTGVTTDKGRLEYAADGTLGVIWRAFFPDKTYRVYAAISRDGGRSFGKPFVLSTKPSTEDVDNGLIHDDGSDIWMTDNTLYAAWGDQRTGVLDSWLATYRYR